MVKKHDGRLKECGFAREARLTCTREKRAIMKDPDMPHSFLFC